FFSSRRRHTRSKRDWSSDVCSSDLAQHLSDASWQRVFGSFTKQFPASSRDFLQPMLHMPDAPLQFANFGLRAGLPAKVLAALLRSEERRVGKEGTRERWAKL